MSVCVCVCVCVCLVGLVRKNGMLVCASELGDERRVLVDICVGCLNTRGLLINSLQLLTVKVMYMHIRTHTYALFINTFFYM